MLGEGTHRGSSYTAFYWSDLGRLCSLGPAPHLQSRDRHGALLIELLGDEENGDAPLGAWHTVGVGSAAAVQVRMAEDKENP